MGVLLETKKLTIYFGGLAAVNKVDIIINHGETVGLIGPNGSGKSTLFNLITGIYKPSHGKCFYKDDEVTGLNPNIILKKGIARTFQNNRLFLNLSVIDNILIGMSRKLSSSWFDSIFRPKYAEKELSEAVEKGRELLEQFSGEMSRDYYRIASELTQSDRRKLEICRALASKPSLLLLDEPSAGMTPEETKELMADIQRAKKIVKGISTIIIEHDMTVIRGIADRVIVLNTGKKIAEGTYNKISNNKEVLEAYLGTEE